MDKKQAQTQVPRVALLWQKGIRLFQEKDYSKASEIFSIITRQDKSNPEAWMMYGVTQEKLRKLTEAEQGYRKTTAIAPGYAEAHANLANVLLKQGKAQQATLALYQALRIKPGLSKARAQLGHILIEKKLFNDAEVLLEDISPSAAADPQILSLLAEAKRQIGKSDEAEEILRRLLGKEPNNPAANNNLAILLLENGNGDEALRYANKAIMMQGSNLDFRLTRLKVLSSLRRFSEARKEYDALLAADPNKVATLFTGRAGDVRFTDETPLARNPYALFVFQWLKRLASCDWQEYDTNLQVCKEISEEEWRSEGASDLTSLQPFSSLLLPLDPAFQFALAQNHSKRILEKIAPLLDKTDYPKTRISRSIIRIGYVSTDFRNHAAAHLNRSLFALHDRNLFEVYGYSLCEDDGSPEHREIQKGCDHFRYLSRLNNFDAAHRIAQDEVDILIDLSGYTATCRPEIFALRPAPIQAHYLGYPGSMGAPWMDYKILGQNSVGSDGAQHFSERIIWLPECHYVISPFPTTYDNTTNRKDHGLPEEGFIYCSFQGSKKIDPRTFSSWMRILQRVPNSFLWLLGEGAVVKEHLRTYAREQGVDPNRLLFADLVPIPDHIARLTHAGLFLDTLVYSGITTVAMTLWAGVPVITCSGVDTMASRQGTEAMISAGLSNGVAKDQDEYEARAVFLATHPVALAEFHAQVRECRSTAALFDTKRTVRYLEKAYKMMWMCYENNTSPREIFVPTLP